MTELFNTGYYLNNEKVPFKMAYSYNVVKPDLSNYTTPGTDMTE